MFIGYLNEPQQSALLHYAGAIMRADGVIGDREKAQLAALCAQTQPGVEARDIPMNELPALFDDRMSRIALMLELVGMGYSDGALDSNEAALVGDIAATLGVEDKLERIESWVKRQLDMVHEAHALMGV